MTASPTNPGPGQPVTFQIKLTNHGQCPVKTMLIVVPFLSDQQLQSLDPGSETQAFLNLVCSGQATSAGVTCTLVGDQILCAGLPPMDGAGLTFNSPSSSETLQCQFSGGTMRCQLPPDLQQALDAARTSAFSQLSANTLSCVPLFGPVLSCGMDTLAPGGMLTQDLVLPAPLGTATLHTLALAVNSTNGVCQGLPANQPCSDNSDCAGGAGVCQDSMCVTGANTGTGCSTDVDCGGATGSCQPCFETTAQTLFTPVGCASTTGQIPTPAVSSMALGGLVLVLLGLGSVMIWRRAYR